MNLELKDKKILVCGSSKGIGQAVAGVLAEEGARLFLVARNEAEIHNEATRLSETFGVDATGYAADLSDPAQVAAMLADLEAHWGTTDGALNNVGGPSPSTALETSQEAWRLGFDQLFLSSTLISQHLARGMIEQQYGRLLTVTSISVVEPLENLAVSSAMRSAVTSFQKTLSREIISFGVTTNCLMPGIIHTGRIDYLRQKRAERLGTSLEMEMEKTIASLPAGRMGKPLEVGRLAAFLLSPVSGYVTGQNICIDGGLQRYCF